MAASNRPDSPWPIIGKLIAALVATGILAAGLMLPYVGGLGLAAGHEAGKFLDTSCNLQETRPPQKTTLYASDGKTVIATLFSQDRVPVALDQIPKYLQQALVATEDRRFYSHHGVDMRGLLRSAVSTGGGNTQGGSTLTMQYVKQIRYYQAGEDTEKQKAAIAQNLNRKIEDAKCAIYIENTEKESKATILDNYLNIAFFGEHSYGIETAAETYFNKHAKDLTLPESALLVGLLRAPTDYDPFIHSEAAKARRNEVLQNLVTVGDLSQAVADKDKQTPVRLATEVPPVVREGCANAQSSIRNVGFFCDYAVNWLETVGGIPDTLLKTGGLQIVTTLNAGLQNTMQRQIEAAIPSTSPMTAVMPVVDPHSGDVMAMATSKLFGVQRNSKDNTHTEQPVFTSYTAQGASTYKLFPLLTALSTGVPSSWALATPTGTGGYVPSNCTTDAPATNGDAQETYAANETLSSATAKSSNTFYVGLADQLLNCDLQPIVDTAKKLGMNSLDQPSGEGQSTVAQTIVDNQRPNELVLGAVGTSPLEIAGAYAGVANDGKFNAPSPIKSITGDSSVHLNRSPGVQVVLPQVARQAIKILQGDTQGFGTSAIPFAQHWYSTNSSIVAGKTGTSVAVVSGKDTSQNAALWFVGMTPNLVATTALINFDHPNAPASGLPNVADPATQAYGAYAAGVWAATLAPPLASQHWIWPSPDDPSLGDTVPPVVGMDLETAKATLAAHGYKLAQLGGSDLQCAGPQPLGKIAYAGPALAPSGATITVCVSNGIKQTIFVPRPTPTPTPGHPTGSPSAGGTPTSGPTRSRGPRH